MTYQIFSHTSCVSGTHIRSVNKGECINHSEYRKYSEVDITAIEMLTNVQHSRQTTHIVFRSKSGSISEEDKLSLPETTEVFSKSCFSDMMAQPGCEEQRRKRPKEERGLENQRQKGEVLYIVFSCREGESKGTSELVKNPTLHWQGP